MNKRIAAALTATAALTIAAGCNAAFGIREGQPLRGCPDALMIDDMEDGDGEICDTAYSPTRRGAWFTVSDGTSSALQPAPSGLFVPTAIQGGRAGSFYPSFYAARMTGSGFTDWGALMGFNLKVPDLSPEEYDASTTGGIKFWMKSNAPVNVGFPVKATIPDSRGGMCADSDDAFNCNNHFTFAITAPAPDQWVEYDVPFAALAQSIKGDAQGNTVFGSVPWTPAKLVGIQFAAARPPTALELAFDVWVDDIQFYGCSDPDCVPTCTDPNLPKPCAAVPSSAIRAACWPAESDCAAVPVLDNVFSGVWGSAANDVYAVGGSSSTGAGTVAHWNGVAWSIVRSEPKKPLLAVWGSGHDDVWAVGERGTTIHSDGSTWMAKVSGTTESLQSVWGSGPGDVWAVGHGGTIRHWNGTAWSDAGSPTTKFLWCLSGSGPADAWAVGFSETDQTGVIVHWDGSRWTVTPNGAPQLLVGVWSNGPADAWAVGWGIVHWNGTVWTAVASPTDAAQVVLVAVWGSGRDDVWAVGTGGTTLHWNGTAWARVESATKQDLYRVWGSGANDVWAAGTFGTVVHWNGSAWSVVPARAIR
jgi:hypothetical protein